MEWLPHTWRTNLLLRAILTLPKHRFNYLNDELLVLQQWHEYSRQSPFRPEWGERERDSVTLTESTFILLFIFIPHNYLLHYMEELCEAGFSVITALVFVYQANTMSANSLLMHAVPLTFREEVREDTSTHNPPWARGSLLFCFFDT